jgi:LmbE family N-acetylglucosaminyl deacetylase
VPEAPDRLADLVYLLRSLPRTGDVLYVGAHPDDEENGLLALLTHHHGVRAWYWSATRGEGGQSRVAPYTGVELGVYRTWESLAARELDGADSLFGPFFDYDFSKNGAEALQKWGADRLVRELVRAIRLVQPQLVISRWRGDASDGHGHHTAVGIAVKEAFVAAGDPARFAELEQVGLPAWQPRKLYQSTMGDWQAGEDVELGVRRPDLEGDGCLRVNTGGFDPIARLTYQEQGALALNAHLTQGVGSVPVPGDYYLYLRLAAVAPRSELDGAIELYEGLDPSLEGLADHPGDGAGEPLRRELRELGSLAEKAAGVFDVDEPWHAGARLLELVRCFRELGSRLDTFGLEGIHRHALERYLGRKQADAATAAAGCLGLRAEATLDRDRLTPGESVRLTCRLWSYGPDAPTEVEFVPSVRLEGAEIRPLDRSTDGLGAEFEITAPADAELTSPYWLRAPYGDYAYGEAEVPHAGQPFDPPLVEVACTLTIGGHSLELTRPALRSEAFAGGYRELELSILPPISVQASTDRHVLRARGVPQTLDFSVGALAHRPEPPIDGVVEIEVPDGWTVEPARADVSLRRAGDGDSIPVRVTVAADSSPGTHEIRYGIRCSGRLYEASITTVMQTAPGLGGDPDEGTCIRRQFVVKPSVVKVDLIDVNVHEGHAYAYVAGISDPVPHLLRSLGLSVQELTDEELTHASLDAFDTIVVGPNAFLVRDALRKAAKRLLEYTHRGGTLIVQYQGYVHEKMSAAPFPFRYNQPHDRVTIEQSPVRIVRPDHFFFHFPNQLDEDDFSGWVRDRGMYFFGEWDPAYQPLLACGDPGEGEKLGGLLVAGYGRGLYTYCGYTLFRQLPAGVRGAFRLFANLLALPEARIRSRMERLRDVSIFAELDEADLHRVATIASERRLSAGEYLFHEGDEGTELYVIEAGALDALRGEEAVATGLRSGPIGELAALTGLRRKASLRASEETHLFAIRSDDFMALLRQDPDLAERMMRLLAGRLSAALEATSPPAEDSQLVRIYE